MSLKVKKSWSLTCCVMGLMTGLVMGFSENLFARGPSGPISVVVAEVQRQPFADRLEALGSTRAKETVVITADTTEKITDLHFEEGQFVETGDVLVTLDQRQEVAQLRAAKAQLAEATSAYARARNLQKRSALSAATVQERLAEKTRNEVQVDVIEARLAELTIQAPFSGVLGLRKVSVGALVKPGDPITTLDDLSEIKVDFQIPSRHLAVLRRGLKVEGTVAAFGDRRFRGQVASIDTQIDTTTRTVRLRATLPNPDGLLKPGLLMHIDLAHSDRDALLMPEEALIKRSDKNYVYRVTSGDVSTVTQALVTVGVRRSGQVEILSGLAAGDQVVAHGTHKLRSGAQISVMAVEQQDETLQQMLQNAQSGKGKSASSK